jgi:hypothetical protein
MSAGTEIAEIRRRLFYDPETGEFRWVNSPRQGWAGKVAGNIDPDTGYVRIRVAGKLRYAHRIAWAMTHGEWPEHEIDHCNRDRSDNRLVNLRSATRSENSCNTTLRPCNRSGHKGVRFYARDGVWVAEIQFKGTSHYLGRFPNKESARQARERAASLLHGDFARAS